MNKLRRARPLLGTLVDITLHGDDEAQLQHVLEAAFTAVTEVHRLMSFHDCNSDVSRLNREAFMGPVQVAPDTYLVLQIARRVSVCSEGLFDITVAAELVSRGLLPAMPGAPVADRQSTWQDVELLADHQVRFSRPLLIDLGGIAKGFAVDQAAQTIREQGAASALINAGGDIYVMGARTEPIYVRHPMTPFRLVPLGIVQNVAVATSAYHPMHDDSALASHVDPFDAAAESHFASVSVAAKSCVIADALTKVLLAGGYPASHCLDSFGASAAIIQWNGEVGALGLRSLSAAGSRSHIAQSPVRELIHV